MGMPRYVAQQFKERLATEITSKPKEMARLVARHIANDKTILEKADLWGGKKAPSVWYWCLCSIKKHFGSQYLYPENDESALLPLRLPDQIERVPAQLYIGIDDRGQADFRSITVCRFFVPTLQKRNAERIAEDKKQLALRDNVLAVENKVYKSRTFPPSVRAMILARDGFCCQACGRSRDELMREGSHLQVDHKIAWEDGGETKYSNGETLCRECNHAKHTTKKFWHAKEALWGRRE